MLVVVYLCMPVSVGRVPPDKFCTPSDTVRGLMCVRADDTTRLLILRLLDGHGTLMCITKTFKVGQEG